MPFIIYIQTRRCFNGLYCVCGQRLWMFGLTEGLVWFECSTDQHSSFDDDDGVSDDLVKTVDGWADDCLFGRSWCWNTRTSGLVTRSETSKGWLRPRTWNKNIISRKAGLVDTVTYFVTSQTLCKEGGDTWLIMSSLWPSCHQFVTY